MSIRIGLVGGPGTGKTSYLRRFIEGGFSPEYCATPVAAVYSKVFNTNRGPLTIHFLDVPGNTPVGEYDEDGEDIEEDIAADPQYQMVKDVEGVLGFFDVTRESSISELRTWLGSTVNPETGQNPPEVVCAHKRDLPRAVPDHTMRGFFEHLRCPFIETSALDGRGLAQSLLAITRLVTKIPDLIFI